MNRNDSKMRALLSHCFVIIQHCIILHTTTSCRTMSRSPPRCHPQPNPPTPTATAALLMPPHGACCTRRCPWPPQSSNSRPHASNLHSSLADGAPYHAASPISIDHANSPPSSTVVVVHSFEDEPTIAAASLGQCCEIRPFECF